MRGFGLTGVFILGLTVVSGRAAAQAAAPQPAAQAPQAAAQQPAAPQAAAQQPAVPQPPPAEPALQPGGYPPPAAGRWIPAPDGSYTWVPAGYAPPPVLPYREGQPVPPGYHLEERPSRGALITGYILTGVPYAIGLIAAVSSNFVNSSAYLLVPWAGPWLTLGLRKDHCESTTDTSDEASDCLEDMGVSMGLVFDGIVQGAGGVVLLAAYLAPRQKLVLDGHELSLNVTRVGTGYGVGASGSF